MATETVTGNETQAFADGLPGLADLLRPMDSFPDKRRAAQAAGNTIEPINGGIAAIGELMWRAADTGFVIEQKTLHGLGCLLVFLADVQNQVGFIETNVNYD
jgi:hypothetical protein